MQTIQKRDVISGIAPLPVGAFLVAILAFWRFGSDQSYESPALLLACNAVFTTLTSILIAVLAGRTFLASGRPSLLWLCCGMLTWGMSALVASVGEHVGNFNITIHNLGVLSAAGCHAISALLTSRSKPLQWNLGAMLSLGLAAALGWVGLVWMGTQEKWLPIFFVDGQGGTPLRTAVLIVAIMLLVLAAVIIRRDQARHHSSFHRWYMLGLVLVAMGGIGLMIQRVHGSEIGWLARAAQYLGSTYILIGAIYAVRETRSLELPLTVNLAQTKATLREREQQLAAILESVTDGFLTLDKDWLLTFVNERITERFGKSREELIGKHIWTEFPDAVGNTAYQQLHRAMEQRITVEYEVFYERWQRWFFDKVAPMADGGIAVTPLTLRRENVPMRHSRSRRSHCAPSATRPQSLFFSRTGRVGSYMPIGQHWKSWA